MKVTFITYQLLDPALVNTKILQLDSCTLAGLEAQGHFDFSNYDFQTFVGWLATVRLLAQALIRRSYAG